MDQGYGIPFSWQFCFVKDGAPPHYNPKSSGKKKIIRQFFFLVCTRRFLVVHTLRLQMRFFHQIFWDREVLSSPNKLRKPKKNMWCTGSRLSCSTRKTRPRLRRDIRFAQAETNLFLRAPTILWGKHDDFEETIVRARADQNLYPGANDMYSRRNHHAHQPVVPHLPGDAQPASNACGPKQNGD